MYSDSRTKSEKVKNGKENKLIRLHGWFSANPCVTSTGEILANMYDDNKTRSKVVRVPYLESTDKNTLHFDEEGKPLNSGTCNANIEYITENINHNICVPDCWACAIVMVNYNHDEETRVEIHVHAFVIPQ